MTIVFKFKNYKTKFVFQNILKGNVKMSVYTFRITSNKSEFNSCLVNLKSYKINGNV